MAMVESERRSINTKLLDITSSADIITLDRSEEEGVVRREFMCQYSQFPIRSFIRLLRRLCTSAVLSAPDGASPAIQMSNPWQVLFDA